MKWTDRIGRRVKLRDLHIALVVADAGSMTRAAEELAVSYPVVSKTISELEHCFNFLSPSLHIMARTRSANRSI
jgi:molybdenum-dependent DNA-binding transcriptional regulator ModE